MLSQQTLKQLLLSLVFSVSFSANAFEEPQNSDWLKPEVGSKGNILFAEVINIDKQADNNIIDVSFPIGQLERFDSAVVIDRRTNQPIEFSKKPKLLLDEKSKPYGIRFHLKKVQSVEFLIQFSDKNFD